MIAYGICDAFASFTFGQLVKIVSRWFCIALAVLINYSLIITMLIWRPSEDKMIILFILAGLWGVADGIWQLEINSFYGVIFIGNDEAAFSNYRLWESIGFVTFYIITPYIRIRIALIILLIFL